VCGQIVIYGVMAFVLKIDTAYQSTHVWMPYKIWGSNTRHWL